MISYGTNSIVTSETLMKLANEAVSKCLPLSHECSALERVCGTCSHHLKQNNIPPSAVQNKMSSPSKTNHLDLSELA